MQVRGGMPGGPSMQVGGQVAKKPGATALSYGAVVLLPCAALHLCYSASCATAWCYAALVLLPPSTAVLLTCGGATAQPAPKHVGPPPPPPRPTDFDMVSPVCRGGMTMVPPGLPVNCGVMRMGTGSGTAASGSSGTGNGLSRSKEAAASWKHLWGGRARGGAPLVGGSGGRGRWGERQGGGRGTRHRGGGPDTSGWGKNRGGGGGGTRPPWGGGRSEERRVGKECRL